MKYSWIDDLGCEMSYPNTVSGAASKGKKATNRYNDIHIENDKEYNNKIYDGALCPTKVEWKTKVTRNLFKVGQSVAMVKYNKPSLLILIGYP